MPRAASGGHDPDGLSLTWDVARHRHACVVCVGHDGMLQVMVAKDEHLPNDPASKALFHGDNAIRIAVDAIKLLIRQDRAADAAAGGADRAGTNGAANPKKRPADALS